MKKDISSMQIEDFANLDFECECGKTHKSIIKKIIIENGALNSVYKTLAELKLDGNILLVADDNTMRVAGNKLLEILDPHKLNIKKCIFHDDHLHADEKSLTRLLLAIEKKTDVILAVGSGTINDIARFIGYKVNIPFVCVGTAPSMDGFASTVAPLLFDDFKINPPATAPIAIICDLDILAKAPTEMIAAGFGDIVGKATSLSDWILGVAVTDEVYCPVIFELMLNALKRCLNSLNGLKNRDDQAIKELTEALILAGVAMMLLENSRPASGSEHGLSHFWEIQNAMRGLDTPLHGIKVGVATRLILHIYNKFINLEEVDFIPYHKSSKEMEIWKEDIKRCYGKHAEDAFNVYEENKLTAEELEEQVMTVKKRWPELKARITSLIELVPDVDSMISELKGVLAPADLNISRQDVIDALKYSKDLRYRYTITYILDQIGLLDKYAEEVADKFC